MKQRKTEPRYTLDMVKTEVPIPQPENNKDYSKIPDNEPFNPELFGFKKLGFDGKNEEWQKGTYTSYFSLDPYGFDEEYSLTFIDNIEKFNLGYIDNFPIKTNRVAKVIFEAIEV